eukprot:9715256-Prorocentrum_lima.AAC.1
MNTSTREQSEPTRKALFKGRALSGQCSISFLDENERRVAPIPLHDRDSGLLLLILAHIMFAACTGH